MPSPHQSLLCQYRYDPLDRLVGQTPANEAQHQRFYCKSRLANEIQGALRHSIVQHGDLLLAQQQSSGDAIETSLLATDQQRSVLHILKKTQPTLPIAYSPYGYRCPENGLLSLLGFNGERRNLVTGHYFLGNGRRAFNPVLMRFNNPDILSPFGKGGLNSYTYCLGDPINRSDPNGHFSILGISSIQNISKKYAAKIFKTTQQKNTITKTKQNLSKYKIFENGFDEKLVKEYKEFNKIQASHSEPLIKSITKLEDFNTLNKADSIKFVLTDTGQLLTARGYLTPASQHYVPSASHAVIAQFAESPNVISAGYLDLSELPKIEINPRSGHYTPTDESLQHVAKFLRDIDANVEIREWGYEY